MRLALVFVLFIFTIPFAKAAVADFVTVNIIFTHDLKGTESDLSTYRKWNKETGAESITVTEDDLAKGKDYVLEKIKKFVANQPNVNLNYSGHGTLEEDQPGEYGPYLTKEGQPCKPKISEVPCERTVIKKPKMRYRWGGKPYKTCTRACEKSYYTHPDQEKLQQCISAGCKAKSEFDNECYKPYYACLDKFRDSDKPQSEISKECGPLDRICKDQEEIQPGHVACSAAKKFCNAELDTFWEKCEGDCHEKYMVDPSDLAKILAGKKVFGIIDACHSQGFAENLEIADKYFLTAAPRELKSKDTPEGGVLTRALEEFATENLCSIAQPGKPISVSSFFGRQLSFTKYSPSPAQSSASVFVSSGAGFNDLNYLKNPRLNCGSQAPQPASETGGPSGSR